MQMKVLVHATSLSCRRIIVTDMRIIQTTFVNRTPGSALNPKLQPIEMQLQPIPINASDYCTYPDIGCNNAVITVTLTPT